MFTTAYRMAGLSLASALACGVAGSANAQLLAHKDISLAMATAMATTAIETCKGQGYNVSVHVLGRDGQVILGLRNELAGAATMENSMKNIVAAQGALPIKVGDDTIGAIGVSGAPGGDKDEACAKAGIDKVSAQLK
jgi:uncharacterized protein GlcG (DUF336 family)